MLDAALVAVPLMVLPFVRSREEALVPAVMTAAN